MTSRAPARRGLTPADHYSYRHYADERTANEFDALRFGGPIGSLVAEAQERVLANFLAEVSGRTILDVGTGTGRAAIALARRGAIVTGLDASDQMLRVATERAAAAGLPARFISGDAHALQFANRAFDAVVCFRVLMHTPDWRLCLRELCRVARDRVVFDYPSAWSVAVVQALGRRVFYRLGGRTQAYRVFRGAVVARALDEQGFGLVSVHKQFVLPIALHKAIGRRGFTEGIEHALAAIGLTRWFGSPVTIVAERIEP
ncbi:MAG: class I SAM-dependent methyltransferase [Acidobacteria bacterium]|nr:class I SAM-dependent methyltransferase [Acidobacteriota bacterium]